MDNLENYTDYRKYLKDYYNDAKVNRRYFSYRYFCNKAGINSPSFYKSVVEGKRNLTAKTIPVFIKGLSLNRHQGEFFTALVYFTQSKSAKEKQKYLEKMRGCMPAVSEKVVPIHYYAYYSKWYNIAIRELACLMDWKNDYSLLANKVVPPIKKWEAREAVQLLLDIGMLKRTKKGMFVQTDPHIRTEGEVSSLAIREVNSQMSKLGMDAIANIPPGRRDISSLTSGISHETYKLFKQEILHFKERLKQLVSNQKRVEKGKENIDRTVYNLNVQLFPLSTEIFPECNNEE